MTNPPIAGQNTTSDHLDCQTWILRVYIHCEGCKKKVLRVLQSIDGVYKTVIDSQQHKATVTGCVDGQTLVQKLLKSGKHAEVLPESFQVNDSVPVAGAGKSKKKKNKKKQSNKHKDGETTGDDDDNIEEPEDAATTDGIDDGNIQETLVAGDVNANGDIGGGKKKKNKKKKKKGDKKEAGKGESEDIAPADTGSMEKLNVYPQGGDQMATATPYDIGAFGNYYPIPAYGMSYSTVIPSAESSYYTPPVYGYAQSHPPPPPPASYYGGSAFDDHYDDDANANGRACSIM